MATLLVAATAVAYVLLAAPSAHAQVLINAPTHKTIRCGGAIKVGVWYQAFSGGTRRAAIQIIQRPSGRTVWSREVVATNRWHYWFVHPACGHRYSANYIVGAHVASFNFRVRR